MSRPLGLALVLALLCAACGDDGPTSSAADAMRAAGTYDVTIEAGGKTDPDVMYVSVGTNGTVLLNFLHSFSQLRGIIAMGGAVTLLSQAVQVEHATGKLDGAGGGTGTFSADGMVSLKVDVSSSGTSDAGVVAGDGGPLRVTYTITGTKRP